MTASHGKNGVVKVATAIVAEVRSFEIQETTDWSTAEAMGDVNVKRVKGLGDVTGSITCWLDGSDTTGQGALTNGALVDLELFSEGEGSGLPKVVITQAAIDNVTDGVDVGGPVEKSFTFAGTQSAAPDRTPQV